MLDGVRLVSEACRARIPIQTAILSASALERGDPALRALATRLAATSAEIVAASDTVLAAVSPVRASSGAVALTPYRPRPWADVVARAQTGLVVAAVGVQDPGNVGAIVRTADAGGAEGVVMVGTSADPFGWRAVRGAMGSTFRLPVAVIDTVRPVLDAARAAGAILVAAVPRGGDRPTDIDLDGPRLLLVGPEGEGLDADLARSADRRVSIPMRTGVDSLNVAVAVGLLIYEARRQRVGAGRP